VTDGAPSLFPSPVQIAQELRQLQEIFTLGYSSRSVCALRHRTSKGSTIASLALMTNLRADKEPFGHSICQNSVNRAWEDEHGHEKDRVDFIRSGDSTPDQVGVVSIAEAPQIKPFVDSVVNGESGAPPKLDDVFPSFEKALRALVFTYTTQAGTYHFIARCGKGRVLAKGGLWNVTSASSLTSQAFIAEPAFVDIILTPRTLYFHNRGALESLFNFREVTIAKAKEVLPDFRDKLLLDDSSYEQLSSSVTNNFRPSVLVTATHAIGIYQSHLARYLKTAKEVGLDWTREPARGQAKSTAVDLSSGKKVKEFLLVLQQRTHLNSETGDVEHFGARHIARKKGTPL
jgi:hypothetical protein